MNELLVTVTHDEFIRLEVGSTVIREYDQFVVISKRLSSHFKNGSRFSVRLRKIGSAS